MEFCMTEKEPNSLQMLIGIATLGWFGYAWDAYMQIDIYGSILALIAGISFIYLARLDAAEKTMPWLFGWKEEQTTTLFFRFPAYASLFVGPATKHLAQLIAPEFFEGTKAYSAVVLVSFIVALVTFLFLIPSSPKNTP
jgi:hypothetical protein